MLTRNLDMISKLKWFVSIMLGLSILVPAWKFYGIFEKTEEYTFGYGYSQSWETWLCYLFPFSFLVFQSLFKAKGKWLYIIEILFCVFAIPYYFIVANLFSEIWIGGWLVIFLIFSYLVTSFVSLWVSITNVSNGLD